MLPFKLDIDYRFLLAGGALVALAVYWQKKVITATGQAINPVAKDNLFNQAAEGFYLAMTDSGQSPGADFYDFLNDPEPVPGWLENTYVGLEHDPFTGQYVTKGQAGQDAAPGDMMQAH